MQLFYFQNNPVDNPEITYQCVLEVFVKSLVMFALAIVLGRTVCRIFPNYNETKKNWELALEIAMQTGLNGSLIYTTRELVDYVGRALIGPTSNVASTYSYVVFALGLFSVQSELKKKILHLITGEKQTNPSVVPNPNDEDLEYDDEEPNYNGNNGTNNNESLSLRRDMLTNQQRGQPMPPTISSQMLGQQYRMPDNNNNNMNNNMNNNNQYNFSGETPISNLNLPKNNSNNMNNDFQNNQPPALQPPKYVQQPQYQQQQQTQQDCSTGACSSNLNKDNFSMNTDALRNYDNSEGYCASGKQGCSAGKWSDSQISHEPPMGDVMAFGSALGGAPIF